MTVGFRACTHLYVDMCSVGQKQLLAQRPLAGRRGKMQRRKSSLVFLKINGSYRKRNPLATVSTNRPPTQTHLVDFGSGLNELTNDHILSVVAGQMKRGVAIRIHLIDLFKERRLSFVRDHAAMLDMARACVCVDSHSPPDSANNARCCSCRWMQLRGEACRLSCPYNQPLLHWPLTTSPPPSGLK